jgi:hypothetical protein
MPERSTKEEFRNKGQLLVYYEVGVPVERNIVEGCDLRLDCWCLDAEDEFCYRGSTTVVL